jgi:uncharacterized protein YciI
MPRKKGQTSKLNNIDVKPFCCCVSLLVMGRNVDRDGKKVIFGHRTRTQIEQVKIMSAPYRNSPISDAKVRIRGWKQPFHSRIRRVPKLRKKQLKRSKVISNAKEQYCVTSSKPATCLMISTSTGYKPCQ